ncbi:Unknown protein [Striga hermonthica]|uniref:F-box associated beta-propeller type 1 domain-containing protein n=1 Tax=Striga hermonthica TaxID=68872 RepID=A0A9N7RG58_STRHE|nr:Unknown protein [Striga hermonthica]
MFLSKILLARAPRQHRTLHSYALLFKSYQSAFSISVRDGRVELSESSPGPTSPARTASSDICLAFSEKESLRHVTLSRRSTGEKLCLPPPNFAGRPKTIRMALWGAAKARFSSAGKLHKVVLCFPPDQHEAVKADEFHILSVGEGSWRVVSFEPRVSETSPVLITEGFMHWCTKNDEKVLSMNLETEVFTESFGPNCPNNINNNVARKDFQNTYLSTGKYLSLLRQCGEFVWEVWEMSPDTFAWRKMGDFSLEGQKRQYFESKSCDGAVKPVGWVKYLEVLVLSTNITSDRNVLVYNLVTQEMKEIELPTRDIRRRPEDERFPDRGGLGDRDLHGLGRGDPRRRHPVFQREDDFFDGDDEQGVGWHHRRRPLGFQRGGVDEDELRLYEQGFDEEDFLRQDMRDFGHGPPRRGGVGGRDAAARGLHARREGRRPIGCGDESRGDLGFRVDIPEFTGGVDGSDFLDCSSGLFFGVIIGWD